MGLELKKLSFLGFAYFFSLPLLSGKDFFLFFLGLEWFGRKRGRVGGGEGFLGDCMAASVCCVCLLREGGGGGGRVKWQSQDRMGLFII